jgi:protein-tyrosine kinase
MSQIYEALLRAEIDRAAAANESKAAAGAGTDRRNRHTDRPYLAPTQGSPASLIAQPIVPPTDGLSALPVGVDLACIREAVWTPSLTQLPALEERGSALEQFRSLRSRMQEFRDLNALKSILVSSGRPQEGKSFVSANLAISFARHKASKVLLIDGDMRGSSLHRVLGCPNGPGLTDYLSGTAGLMEIMQRAKPRESGAPLRKGLASLTFIPAGTDTENAADLSGNRRFAALLEVVSPLFDWIIVDSSPVNLVSDGVNLAHHCDGVLLVARGGSTEFKTAQRAMSELKASKLLGFVLNAVKDAPTSDDYYGYDSNETHSPEV